MTYDKPYPRLWAGADSSGNTPTPISPAALDKIDKGIIDAHAELDGRLSEEELSDTIVEVGGGAFVSLASAAKNPDLLVVGNITRDANQAVTSADVVWPDGKPGTFTALTLSTAFPGAVDSYKITYGSPVTKTFTQPDITRNSAGAATTVPQIVVS